MPVRHFLAALLTLSLFSPATWGAGGNVIVVATNVKTAAGSIIVKVYDSKDSWLGDGWRTRKVIAVAANRVEDTVTLEFQLPPGEYALTVFQDMNDDGKLARNFLGIPKEPTGLSNNVRPKLGSPSFNDAKFKVGATPVEQRIRLE